MRKTADAAIGKWREILVTLGVDRSYLTGNHGPCPLCQDGTNRYRFDDLEGRGTYYCSKCGPGDGMAFAEKWTGQPFRDVARRIDEICGNLPDKPVQTQKTKDPAIRLRKIHKETCFVQLGDAVDKYLSNRGFSVSEDGSHIVSCIRTHSNLDYYEKDQNGKAVKIGSYPAMVTMFSDVNGQPCSYHVTYLTEDGRKAPVASVRKLLPPVTPLDGGAVRLGGAPQSPILGICEGIETALSVKKMFNVQCWAALNAVLLEKFECPPGVKELRIYADNDSSYTGQKAAYVLAWRMRKAGLTVRVLTPSAMDTDYNDSWMEFLKNRAA